MTDWSPILQWRLLAGSHPFPGPQGGTCINEAAVVAAGFDYREVCEVEDLPPCFCRLIATYALTLNDEMDDVARQRLAPYAPRLAGTADTEAVQLERAAALALGAAVTLAPIDLRASGRDDVAVLLEQVDSLESADHALAAIRRGKPLLRPKSPAEAIADSVAQAQRLLEEGVVRPSDLMSITSIIGVAAARLQAWDEALALFDDLLAIGAAADPLEHALITARLDAAKQSAAAAREPADVDAPI